MFLSKRSSGKQAERSFEQSDLQNQPEPPRYLFCESPAEGQISQNVLQIEPIQVTDTQASQTQKIRSNLGEIEPKYEKRQSPLSTVLEIEVDPSKPDFSLGNSGSICKSPLHEISSLLGHKREGHLTFAPVRTNSGGSNNQSLGESSPMLAARYSDERGNPTKSILTSSLTPVLGSTGVLSGNKGDLSHKYSLFMKMSSQELDPKRDSEVGFVEDMIRTKVPQKLIGLQQTDEVHEDENSVLIYENSSEEFEEPGKQLDYRLSIPDQEVKSILQSDDDALDQDPGYKTPTLDPQHLSSRNSHESNQKREESGPLAPVSFEKQGLLMIRPMPGAVLNSITREQTKRSVYDVQAANKSSILEFSTGSPLMPNNQQSKVASGDDLVAKILEKDSCASVPVLPVKMDPTNLEGSNNTLPDASGIKRSGKKNQAAPDMKDNPAYSPQQNEYGASAQFKPLQVLNQKGHLALSPSFGPDEFSKLLKTREATQGSHFNDSKRSINKQARRSTLSGPQGAEAGPSKHTPSTTRQPQQNPFLHLTASASDNGNDGNKSDDESRYSEVTEMRTVVDNSPIMRGIESVPRDTSGSRFRIPLLKSTADDSDTAEFNTNTPRLNDQSDGAHSPDQLVETKQKVSPAIALPPHIQSEASKTILPLALGCIALLLVLVEVFTATHKET